MFGPGIVPFEGICVAMNEPRSNMAATIVARGPRLATSLIAKLSLLSFVWSDPFDIHYDRHWSMLSGHVLWGSLASKGPGFPLLL